MIDQIDYQDLINKVVKPATNVYTISGIMDYFHGLLSFNNTMAVAAALDDLGYIHEYGMASGERERLHYKIVSFSKHLVYVNYVSEQPLLDPNSLDYQDTIKRLNIKQDCTYGLYDFWEFRKKDFKNE